MSNHPPMHKLIWSKHIMCHYISSVFIMVFLKLILTGWDSGRDEHWWLIILGLIKLLYFNIYFEFINSSQGRSIPSWQCYKSPVVYIVHIIYQICVSNQYISLFGGGGIRNITLLENILLSRVYFKMFFIFPIMLKLIVYMAL